VVADIQKATGDTTQDYYKPYGEYGDGSYADGDVIEVTI
jgi:hypothetical protein